MTFPPSSSTRRSLLVRRPRRLSATFRFVSSHSARCRLLELTTSFLLHSLLFNPFWTELFESFTPPRRRPRRVLMPRRRRPRRRLTRYVPLFFPRPPSSLVRSSADLLLFSRFSFYRERTPSTESSTSTSSLASLSFLSESPASRRSLVSCSRSRSLALYIA